MNIEVTVDNYQRLKSNYERVLKLKKFNPNKEDFTFKGRVITLAYAKLMIEYMHGELLRLKEIKK